MWARVRARVSVLSILQLSSANTGLLYICDCVCVCVCQSARRPPHVFPRARVCVCVCVLSGSVVGCVCVVPVSAWAGCAWCRDCGWWRQSGHMVGSNLMGSRRATWINQPMSGGRLLCNAADILLINLADKTDPDKAHTY